MTDLTTKEVEELRVSLREYIDVRISSLEHSIITADTVLNTRLEGMNEFRESMRDQSSKFFTRAEHEIWKEKIEGEIHALKEFRVAINSKADQRSVVIAYGIAALSIVISVLGLIESFTR